MKRYYANLLGNWIDITDTATVGDNRDVSTWFAENLRSPMEYDYINVQYKEKNYRIHPSMIQIITQADR